MQNSVHYHFSNLSVHRHSSTMQNTIVIALLSLVAVVLGGHHGLGGHGEEDNGPAYYKFEYGVHDPHSHDIKSQHEHAQGKHLDGGYTLKEADGTTRVVKYHADKHGGFQAVVERQGHAQHPAVYGKHKHHGGQGGTSWVGVTHWGHGHGH